MAKKGDSKNFEHKMFFNSNNNQLVILLVLFGSLIIVTNYLIDLSFFSNQIDEVALTNAVKKTKEREAVFTEFFKRSKDTIFALRKNKVFIEYLEKSLSKAHLEELMLYVANSQQNIMQIRFLNHLGMEGISIERHRLNEAPIVTTESNLQDMSDRYYFTESARRSPETVWYSDLDLKIEHDKSETPYKETLRAIMPIFHHGEFKGVLIINYYMRPFLEILIKAPLYNMILADGDGEIIVHYDNKRNWSRYTDEPGLSFDIPNIRDVLLNDTHRTSWFFSRKLNLPTDNQLLLILSLNDKYLANQKKLFIKNSIYNVIISLIITVIFSYIIARLTNKFFYKYKNRGKLITKLQEMNAEIEKLLLKNKIYMEMASDGIHILDKSGNIVAFSKSFADMLGYAEKELSQLNIQDWGVKTKEQLMEAMNSFTKEPSKIETRHRCKDGSIINVEINARWINIDNEGYLYASSRDITQRKRMEKELQELATTDFLTGLPTRRKFISNLSDELERFHRNKNNTVAVVMIDLDNFKVINDTYGHLTGDQVLKHFAVMVGDELRRIDTAGRLGGEEFGLVLPGNDAETAKIFTNRLRIKFADSPLYFVDKVITCTVSIGITEFMEDDTTVETILNRADKALYCAKELGRNRVEVFENSDQIKRCDPKGSKPDS